MSINGLDMLLVHRVFRRELHTASAMIEGVAPGDAGRAQFIGDHLTFMLACLHHQHAAEDEVVWPTLRARAPGSTMDLQRMVSVRNTRLGIVLGGQVLDGATPDERRVFWPACLCRNG